MRFSHNLHIIRRRKHVKKISAIITVIIVLLILFLGFTRLDAEKFFVGFFESLYRVTISYFISVVLALLITLIVTSSKKLEEVFVPILDVLQSFPSFALFPILVLWFGKTTFVTVIILIITMIWPILFTVLSAQKQIRKDLLEAAQSFGAIRSKFLIYVLLPSLYPSIVTGSLVAWGEAWEAIIAAEIIVSITGVGTYLADTANTNPQLLAIGVTLLLMLLFLLNKYIWLPLLNTSTKYQTD